MPKLTVEGFNTVDVDPGKRLVLAIEQDAGVDILHACGGNARCTTCRVEFVSGEPSCMTTAEKTRLEERDLTGVRLSCQLTCDSDMTVRASAGSPAADAQTRVGRRRRASSRPPSGADPIHTLQLRIEIDVTRVRQQLIELLLVSSS